MMRSELAILIIATLMVSVAWASHVGRRWALLFFAWVFSAVTLGYVGYRRHCSQGLMCDVVGINYLAQYWPLYGAGFASIFGVSVLTVLMIRRAYPAERLWPRPLVLGSLATVGAWTLLCDFVKWSVYAFYSD
jgi:hypothetical protein